MASNTFYAKINTNSSNQGVLNGGEMSWERASKLSWTEYEIGWCTFDTTGIRNTIPAVATISSVTASIQIKQSRSTTSVYETSCRMQLHCNNAVKSEDHTSGKVSNSYETKSVTNNVAITSAELHAGTLYAYYAMRWKGTLKTTQYAKDIKCTINWSPINTTALAINKTSTTLNVGATETLSVTRTPASVSYPTISWSSSNTSVATVNASGVVTAVGNGTATITAKTTDGTNISKTCSVTVQTPVSGVTVSPTSLSLNAGSTYTLTKSISPSTASNQNVTWSSSNTSVATVNASGVVTAVGNGTATITCTSSADSSKKGTCSVTVTTAVTGVTVSPTTLSLNVGGTHVLSKTVLPATASNPNVTWSTSNTAVVTVDSNGKVTAIARGTCTITCTSNADSSKKGTCSITVNQQATGISMVPASKEMWIGTPKPNLFNFNKWLANGLYADGAHVSSNNYGFTLTSTRNDSFTSGYHMGTAASDSQKEIVDKYGFSVTAGREYTLSVDINQNSANQSEMFIFWYNVDKGYITHNSNGLNGPGNLSFTVTAPSGAAYACIRLDNNISGYTNLYTNIRVQENDNDLTTIGQCDVYAKVMPYNVSNETYTLTSSDTSVATVSGNGAIIAVSAGTTIITATSSDGGHKASCTITVKQSDITKIANGAIFIKNMMLGSTNIKSAYIGNIQIYKQN